ncbi:MAG: plasmid stabilization protein [Patescibacteria group bacterium]
MELRFTPSFEREYKKIVRGNETLQKKVRKQLTILEKNANYPSLRLHKLGSSKYWSISIDTSIRVLIILEKQWIYVYHIGKHEDVY